jgi:DNA adenine methylase
VLSGYDSDLYDELYGGWTAIRIPATTGQGGTREERTEVLWFNREPFAHLFSDQSEAAS